jgi:hypothetical protein
MRKKTLSIRKSAVMSLANIASCNTPQAATYFLKTVRLGFRSWSPADTELAMGLWGNPEVTGFVGGPFSREQAMERLSSMRKKSPEDDFISTNQKCDFNHRWSGNAII